MTSPADIPGAYVRDVIALCARWQVPAAALTRGLPITAAALDAPTTRVPIEVCAEVVARVIAEAFDYLDAPPLRVHQEDVPLPYAANLEALSLPGVDKILAAVKAVMA